MSQIVHSIPSGNLPLICLEANGVKDQFENARNTPLGSSSADKGSVSGFLGCFACELYLKFIIGSYDLREHTATIDIKHGHNLWDLFNFLNDDHKDTVRKNLIVNKVVRSIDEFDTLLSKISLGFQNYRYYFEQKEGDIEIDSDTGMQAIKIPSCFITELINELSSTSKEIVDNMDLNDVDISNLPIIIME